MSAASTDEKGVILICHECGQKNRTPYERLAETGQCGKCKAELPPPGTPVEVTQEAHFDLLIGTSALPVVVDFWASWCRPCLQVAPELEKVAAQNAGQFIVAKVSTETLPTVARRFNVQSIPLLAVFVDGKEAARSAGARPAALIEAFIRQAIGT